MAAHITTQDDAALLAWATEALAKATGSVTDAVTRLHVAALNGDLAVLRALASRLGVAAEAGALVLEAGGSVGTSALARSIALAAALARHYKRPYTPVLPPPNLSHLPQLDAALPAVLCAA